MRFIVLDCEGVPLRAFHSRAEAESFCLDGYTLRVKPKPAPEAPSKPYADALQAVGEAPF